MTDSYVVYVKNYDSTDPRLGRRVRHDSRSLQYLAPVVSPATLVSKKWVSKIPVLAQGDIGSCTGNAGTKALTYVVDFWNQVKTSLSTTDASLDEGYAIGLYSDATKADPYEGTYPPDDTGSDGLSIAKVLKARGLISGYTHATSMDAVLTALQTGAVIVGTEWTSDMFEPDDDGRLYPTGSVQGGHEYVLDEVDVERKRVWMQNSWDTNWGVNGRAYFTWDDFKALLAKDGDCTVFVPVTVPAPVPTPVPVVNAEEAFVAAATEWLSHGKSTKVNKTFASAVKSYLVTIDV